MLAKYSDVRVTHAKARFADAHVFKTRNLCYKIHVHGVKEQESERASKETLKTRNNYLERFYDPNHDPPLSLAMHDSAFAFHISARKT